MENAELIKIAIAAAVGAALKETFSVLIRSSASVAKMAAAKTLPLIIRNLLIIDFFITVGLFIFILGAFVWTPFPNAGVTHFHAKCYVFMGIILAWEGASVKASFRRYKNKKISQVQERSATN